MGNFISPSSSRQPSPPSSRRPPSPPSSRRSHSPPSSLRPSSSPSKPNPPDRPRSRIRKPSEGSSYCSLEPLLPLSHRVTLKYNGDVITRHSTDTDDNGWITGGVILDNGMLSLVDHINYSVKIIDVNSNTVISCIKLPTRPWNITRVEQEQVVVTCYDKLVFIKVGDTLSVVKEVNSIGDCCGIVCTNNTLIVSFLNPGSVKVLNLEGHVLNVISTDYKGRQLFEEPCYIALSPDQETLYVSDEAKHIVISMDLNGTVHHVYNRDTLKNPRSLAVDIEGNIYIAGRAPYLIHIISQRRSTIRILHEAISEVEINNPFAIICCKKDNILYISHFSRFGIPKVSAYQLPVRGPFLIYRAKLAGKS